MMVILIIALASTRKRTTSPVILPMKRIWTLQSQRYRTSNRMNLMTASPGVLTKLIIRMSCLMDLKIRRKLFFKWSISLMMMTMTYSKVSDYPLSQTKVKF